MNNEMNQNPAGTQPEDNGIGAKTFTQEDVNRIVQERLARDRSGRQDGTEAAKRMAEIERREARMECREYIAEKGYSKDLLDILGTDDVERFKELAGKLEASYSARAQNAPAAVENAQLDRAYKKLIEAEVRALSGQFQLNDVDAALALMPQDAITVDADGEVQGAREALNALRASKPYLFGTGKAWGQPHGSEPPRAPAWAKGFDRPSY